MWTVMAATATGTEPAPAPAPPSNKLRSVLAPFFCPCWCRLRSSDLRAIDEDDGDDGEGDNDDDNNDNDPTSAARPVVNGKATYEDEHTKSMFGSAVSIVVQEIKL